VLAALADRAGAGVPDEAVPTRPLAPPAPRHTPEPAL